MQQVEIPATDHAGGYVCKIGGLAREDYPEMDIIDYRFKKRGEI